VLGIGIDFTACTMLPVDAAGEALCFDDRYAAEPHAWVKLWKHHAAQPEADAVNRVAGERGEAFLSRYGGKISSEWMIPKILQILNEAPHVYLGFREAVEPATLQRWVAAVNADGRYGEWHYVVSRDMNEIPSLLATAASSDTAAAGV